MAVIGGSRADAISAATAAAAGAQRPRAELLHLDELVDGRDITVDSARERGATAKMERRHGPRRRHFTSGVCGSR